jgi:basic membrane protein A and related proteins
MMRKLQLFVACLFATLSLTAQAAPKKPVKIALIVESTVDDKGWCQAMHDAIKSVQAKYGKELVDYSYSEKMKPVDAGSAARQYASKGYDLIIGHGAQYKNLMLELSEEFPKVSFAFGTSADIGPKNVFTYMPQSEETGYLNGLVAGLVTRSNVIGLVGPVDGGDAARYDRGFVLGVKAVNPKAEVKVAHTGSFGDFVKAGELAQTQIKAGADVLTGSSQQALGALRAVAAVGDKTILWLGQDLSQLTIPEGKVALAASSYNYAAVIEKLIEKREAGVLGGENIGLSFSNGGFVHAWHAAPNAALTKEIRAKVEAALAELKAGKLPLDWKSVKF